MNCKIYSLLVLSAIYRLLIIYNLFFTYKSDIKYMRKNPFNLKEIYNNICFFISSYFGTVIVGRIILNSIILFFSFNLFDELFIILL